MPHVAAREREAQQAAGQAAVVLQGRHGIRCTSIERGPHQPPAVAHGQRVGRDGGGRDPLGAVEPRTGLGERPDREPVETREHLAVERRRRMPRPLSRVEPVPAALAALPPRSLSESCADANARDGSRSVSSRKPAIPVAMRSAPGSNGASRAASASSCALSPSMRS
ncbi:hypothetical protein GCM10025881_28830 [Pseudolysinimonas kribbensis]|uniref:Uncharacterized protein n=1 Tax=Pseudolysinimonas kribbensis TaxID=433641 RepID=A0ABQ6K6Q5_9MICO|nr:hypothetical protein GCM10025881_28830 [Pseudolysinimonas kribbensis]